MGLHQQSPLAQGAAIPPKCASGHGIKAGNRPQMGWTIKGIYGISEWPGYFQLATFDLDPRVFKTCIQIPQAHAIRYVGELGLNGRW